MRTAVSLIALVALAGSVQAQDISQVNGYNAEVRLYNDFPGSTLLLNGVNEPVPAIHPLAYGPVHFQEQFAAGEPGNFANKHVAWLSTNGGATRAETNVFQSWSIDFFVTMNAASAGPRKEAGIEFWQPRPALGAGNIDQGQLLIASDNGEVAVFGAAMPFTGFGVGAYTLGTTAHVLFEYFAPGVVDPTLGAYRLRFTDAVTGLHDSGFKIWSAFEPDGVKGLTHANVGLKDQNQRNPFIADNVSVLYNGVTVIPAPAGLAMLGFAGLAACRRRR